MLIYMKISRERKSNFLGGAVKRVGRSDAYASEFDLEAEEYVPLPKGNVFKRKNVVQNVTLHDLDQVQFLFFNLIA